MKVALLSAGVVNKKGYARNLCLLRGLANLGDEVTLLICNDKMRWERSKVDGVEVVAFPKVLSYRLAKGGLDPLDTISRCIYLSRRSFDIIHADVGFRPAAGLPGHCYSRRRRVPYVCDWWDWVGFGGMLDRRAWIYQQTLGRLDNFFEVWDKQHADGVITISRCLQERAVEAGIPVEKTSIIHGGADLTGYKGVSRAEAKRRMGFEPDDFVVGFSGMGSHEYQNLAPFLRAVPQLRASINRFCWFSTGDKLPEHARREFDIGEEYRDLGWVTYDDYWWALAAADVLLLTLRDSTTSRARWPNKLGDYLAAGRAIIASDIGEVSGFVQRFPGGVRLVANHPASVAEALTEFINRPQLIEEMGRRNLEIARAHYSWDAKARELRQFYERILNAKQPKARLSAGGTR